MDDKFLSGGGYTGTQWSAHSDPYSIIPFGKSSVSRISKNFNNDRNLYVSFYYTQ